MSEHTIIKRRLQGNQTIRADRKDITEQFGSGVFLNVTLRGVSGSAAFAREKAEQYAAIADELERLAENGNEADW